MSWNYRGIAITALIGKVLEHVALRLDRKLDNDHHDLQFGFTKDRQPTMATLCLTENIAHAKDTNKDLWITTLDAQKAFDVVRHSTLKFKIHQRGTKGRLWRVIDDLYTNCKETTLWAGDHSRTYDIQRGVRQGGVLSAPLYKTYADSALTQVSRAMIGCKIGNIILSSPTCADDVLLASNNAHEMQCMINLCAGYAEENGYKLHPQKSVVTHLIGNCDDPKNWQLGNKPMTTSTEFIHLGLNWHRNSLSPDVDKNIQSARATAYALMGAGMYGENGASPAVSSKMISTYVLPRLVYGLDAVVLNKKQVTRLSVYYRSLLRQIQGLPGRTSNEAVHLLSGTLPLEATLHTRIFSLFGAIQRLNCNHTMYQLAERQLAIGGKHSWFTLIKNLLKLYNLDLDFLWNSTWDKLSWKRLIKATVQTHWFREIIQSTKDKSTLSKLDPTTIRMNTPHVIWSSCADSTRQVAMAMVRAKMLSGVYTLQTSKRGQADPTDISCPLCKQSAETLTHVLVTCPKYQHLRSPILVEVESILRNEDFPPPNNSEQWLLLILNGPSPCMRKIRDRPSENCENTKNSKLSCDALRRLHQLSNKLCSIINVYRINALSE